MDALSEAFDRLIELARALLERLVPCEANCHQRECLHRGIALAKQAKVERPDTELCGSRKDETVARMMLYFAEGGLFDDDGTEWRGGDSRTA